MKFLLRVLCVLCGLSCFCSALDRHAFTFTDYNLTITLDPPHSSFSAEGTVTLRNDTTEPQKIAELQVSSSLAWKSITVNDKRVQYVSQPYTSDIDHTGELSEALVTLPTAVPPGGSVTLKVDYDGTIGVSAGRLTRIGVPEATATASDWDRVSDPFTIVRGIGYVAWYPIATDAVSLSSGNEVFDEIAAWKQREASAKLTLEFSPKTTVVLTRPVPLFAAGSYERLSRPELDLDHLPAHAAIAEDFARALADATPFVLTWFGTPREPVHIVELPWPGTTPWESGPLLFTELKQEQPTNLALTLVHQLVHAAFHSPRPWIYEGAAHFAQAMDRDKQSGRAAAIAYMQSQAQPLVAAELPSLPDVAGNAERSTPRKPESLVTTADELFYRTKAMFVWWMLHDMVGEAALQRAFHAYKPEDDKVPAYIQHLIEKESNRNLEWFFDDWVYRDRGLPDFRVQNVYPRQTMNGIYLVTITVENRGGAGAEVPVIIQTAHGESTRRLLVRAHATGVLRLEMPDAPTRVTVNDGSVPESDRSNNVFEVPPRTAQ